jgi:hypothetical protein
MLSFGGSAVKFRSSSLDDAHLETLTWLDDLDYRWSHTARAAVNFIYRVHRALLMLLIRICWKGKLRRKGKSR